MSVFTGNIFFLVPKNKNSYLFFIIIKKRLMKPLPANEIMDIIYHSSPTTWENKMIKVSITQTLPSKI